MSLSRDRDPFSFQRLAVIRERLQTFLNRRGYEIVDVPTLEATELFLRKSGGELAAKMYTFNDPAGRKVSLRPEFTSSVVRAFIAKKFNSMLPLRLQYSGPVFRYEGSEVPELLRTIEFDQLGAELFGVNSEYADAEIMALAAQGITKLGVKNIRMKFGHAEVLNNVFRSLGLNERTRIFVIKNLEELRKNGSTSSQVKTKAQVLSNVKDASAKSLLEAIGGLDDSEALGIISDFFPDIANSPTGKRSKDEILNRYLKKLREIEDPSALKHALDFAEQLISAQASVTKSRAKLEYLFNHFKIPTELLIPIDKMVTAFEPYAFDDSAIIMDLSLAQDIAYYTGVIFTIESSRSGKNVILGAGGRYDGLVKALGGTKDVAALGFAYDLERVQSLLPETFGLEEIEPPQRVLVTADDPELSQAVATAERLRAQGIFAEVDMIKRNYGETAKYAKARGIATVMRIGKEGIIDEQNVQAK
tara:strand:- start:4346 stop:5770 length:1425 start_codon:yes stop_codon:yes gene_type:complete